MASQKWYYSWGIGITLLSGLFLVGAFKLLLGIDLSENLFNTGISASFLLGILNLVLVYWLTKRYL